MKIEELNINKYIKENVRHRAFNSCLTEFPGVSFLATRAVLYPTTEKNHPVSWMLRSMLCHRSLPHLVLRRCLYYFPWHIKKWKGDQSKIHFLPQKSRAQTETHTHTHTHTQMIIWWTHKLTKLDFEAKKRGKVKTPAPWTRQKSTARVSCTHMEDVGGSSFLILWQSSMSRGLLWVCPGEKRKKSQTCGNEPNRVQTSVAFWRSAHVTGYSKKRVSWAVHLFFVGIYSCFIKTWCINNDWKYDIWHLRCPFYQVESILFNFQQLQKNFFPKILMKYSKNSQKFAMSKNTSDILFETFLTPCKKPHIST